MIKSPNLFAKLENRNKQKARQCFPVIYQNYYLLSQYPSA